MVRIPAEELLRRDGEERRRSLRHVFKPRELEDLDVDRARTSGLEPGRTAAVIDAQAAWRRLREARHHLPGMRGEGGRPGLRPERLAEPEQHRRRLREAAAKEQVGYAGALLYPLGEVDRRAADAADVDDEVGPHRDERLEVRRVATPRQAAGLRQVAREARHEVALGPPQCARPAD